MGRRIDILGVVLVAMFGLAGCGSSSSGSVVAQVGNVAVAEATLDHWTSVLASEAGTSSARTRALRRRALSFLISCEWQIGEAAEQGQAVSPQEVKQRFEKRVKSHQGGRAEFDEVLKLTGRTASDVMFETETELAASRLKRLAMRHQVKVTPAQIVSYYRANRQSFTVPEQRHVEVVYTENEAAAKRIKSEGASGRSLPSVAQPESLVYVKGLEGGTDTALARAIFAAKRGVFVGPVQVGPNYFVFEVTQVMPGSLRTLATVRRSIEGALESEQRQRATAELIQAWRMRWIAKTDCRPGFVVQKCRQYTTSKSSPPEDRSTFN